MLLALDLGTKTGYACFVDGQFVTGTLPLGTKNRYRVLWDWLAATLRPGDAVYFEDVRRHLGTRAAHVYGGLKAIVETACCDVGASCTGVPVGTIKKSWTGNGAAKKPDMIAAARRRGFAPLDDNEADAIALLYYAQGENAKEAPSQ